MAILSQVIGALRIERRHPRHGSAVPALPRFGCSGFSRPWPVQCEEEWNEANGALATISPELAQDRAHSKRGGNRVDGIADLILAKFRRRSDRQFPADGGRCS